MYPPSLILPVLPGTTLLLLPAGCQSFEPGRAHREETDAFTRNRSHLAEAEAVDGRTARARAPKLF